MGRTVFLFIIGLFLLFSVGNAQQVAIGIKGGLDFAKISGESFLGNYSPSFEGGAFATLKLNAKWGLQTELVYSQEIEKVNADALQTVYNNGIANNLVTTTATIGAITLPLLVTYQINNLFSLNAGPAFTLNSYTNENLFASGQTAFKQTDVSLCGGASLNLGGVSFYARYTHGLTSINNYDNNDSWKSRRLSFGLEIPIKHFK